MSGAMNVKSLVHTFTCDGTEYVVEFDDEKLRCSRKEDEQTDKQDEPASLKGGKATENDEEEDEGEDFTKDM